MPAFRCLLLLPLLLFLTCTPAEDPEPRPYLEAAQQTAAWLDSVSIAMPEGTAWPADVLRPDTVVTHTLGDGVPGIVVFFLELHRATQDGAYLNQARRGADYLLTTLPGSVQLDASPRLGSLYADVPGTSFALYETFKATGDARYRDGAIQGVTLLHETATETDEGVYWDETYNDVLYGTAGTGLFLLYAAREMGHAASQALAAQAGQTLLRRARPEQGGLTWLFREDRDFILPNFSHGTAGLGYFLAMLYDATGEQDFLDAALGAATYLEAIARTEHGGFLVPYGWPNPDWEGHYDVGWAHGPAGTARLFYKLHQITGEARWMDLVKASAQGIRQSGLPHTPQPGFGDEPFKPDLRFGTASVALFFLDLYQETNDSADLAYARTLVDDLLARATHDAGKRHWEAPRYAFFEHGGEPAAFTGYFYGAAGYGLVLLRLDAAQHSEKHKIALPDDPFVVEEE